jgi:hypothetical protein
VAEAAYYFGGNWKYKCVILKQSEFVEYKSNQDIKKSTSIHKKIIFVFCRFWRLIQKIKSVRMGWVRNVASMGEKRNASHVLMGKMQGKRAAGRLRHRWTNNIKTSLRKTG